MTLEEAAVLRSTAAAWQVQLAAGLHLRLVGLQGHQSLGFVLALRHQGVPVPVLLVGKRRARAAAPPAPPPPAPPKRIEPPRTAGDLDDEIPF